MAFLKKWARPRTSNNITAAKNAWFAAIRFGF
jgi:hypothetical protein